MKNKIILVSSSSISFLNYRYELISSLCAQNFEVIACAPNDKNSVRVRQTLSKMNVKLVGLTLSNTGVNPFVDLMTLYQLHKIIKAESPDYVLSFSVKPVIYTSIIAKKFKLKHVYSMITGLGHVFSGQGIKNKVLNAFVQRLYRYALNNNRKVFFQNTDDIELFFEKKILSKDKVVRVNGSGVNLHYYNQVALPSTLSFILIARLLKNKGVYEYVNAAKLIKKKYPNVIFYLVGGFESNTLGISQEEVDSWVKSKIIDYTGYLDDIRPAISQSKVFVLPSYYREGVPHAILEAMAMGRPIITTNTPGCRETVIPGVNGYLITKKSTDELAATMLKFVENDANIEAMGQASRKIAAEKFDVIKVVQIMLSSMSIVINSNNGS